MAENTDSHGKIDYAKNIRKAVGEVPLIFGAAGAIIEDGGGKILLVKRCDCGKWGVPGGLMNFGETVEQTAVREVKEETGLDIECVKLLGIYTGYLSRDRLSQPLTAIFTARAVGGELYCDLEETAEIGFFGGDELPEIYCKQHEDIVADYFSGRLGIFR